MTQEQDSRATIKFPTHQPRLVAHPMQVRCGSGKGATTLAWTTGDGSAGEVCVAVDGRPEQLFCTGDTGATTADWIAGGSTYEFRLYAGPSRTLLRSIVVTGDSSTQWIVDQVKPMLENNYPANFRFWEKQGIHLTPVHFYQPIPDTRTLTDETFARECAMPGIDMNEAAQLELLTGAFPEFRDEFGAFPTAPTGTPSDFHFNNNRFDGTDACVLYSIVRHFKPRSIVEVGSGYSSRVSAMAALKNGDTKLTCIEPYPDDVLTRGFPGLSKLIVSKVQDVPLETFEKLRPGDVFFIDTAHVVTTGGDVNYLFLEVLPRIAPGVIVHVHDIYFPFEYPKHWVMDEMRFWNEQYLLQTFLMFNDRFDVLFANNYMAHRHPAEMKKTFPKSPWWGGGSFWMRRKE